MDKRINNLVIGTFTFLGFLCIISGIAMPDIIKFEKTAVGKLEVRQQRVTNAKNNEIKLKDIVIEADSSLSTYTKDYLLESENIENSVIAQLKLDTSKVNINAAGTYVYTITYHKKIYNGNIIVNPKALPNIDHMTLNSLSYEIGTELSTDLSVYIKEELTDEVKNATRIDLSNVDPKKAGVYLYSISYNGKFYTNTITIYEPQLTKTTTNKKDTN